MFRDYFAHAGVSAIVFPATVMPAPLMGPEQMHVQLARNAITLDEVAAASSAPRIRKHVTRHDAPADVKRSKIVNLGIAVLVLG